MFRIAYVLEGNSIIGKVAAIIMLILVIGIPLLFLIFIEGQILIEKIKKRRNNKKKGNKL